MFNTYLFSTATVVTLTGQNVTFHVQYLSCQFYEYVRNARLLCTLQVNNSHLVICFFWVIPRRLSSNSRRFGTLYLFHLHRQVDEVLHRPAYEDGTDTVFRNVCY